MDGVATNIKTEPIEADDLEGRIIQLCQTNSVGITNDLLLAAIPNSSKEQITGAINNLLTKGRIELFKQGKQGKQGKLLYKLKNVNAAKQLKNFSNEERLVFEAIEKSGSKGIWLRDIRVRCNIPSIVLNKILKSLETNKHIKAVKSVSAAKKKVYMLYNLEPDSSVTGGAWYCDQEFESEFVEVLNKQCYAFLNECRNSAEKKGGDAITCRNASYKSSRDVWKYINDLKVSRVELSVENIEAILNTLITDEKVEKRSIAEGSSSKGQPTAVNLYRAIPPIVPSSALLRMPCGVCRVYKDCWEGGTISPSTCIYMKEWFDY